MAAGKPPKKKPSRKELGPVLALQAVVLWVVFRYLLGPIIGALVVAVIVLGEYLLLRLRGRW